MTTVVATRTGIWTDSQCNYQIDFPTVKSHYIKDSTGAEFLVAFCGDLSGAVKAVELLKRCPLFEAFMHVPEEYFTEKTDFSLLIVTRDKRLLEMDQEMVSTPILLDAYCVGTGSHWAQSALDFGKTPEEAVEYAISKDRQSGPPVRSLKFPRKTRE